MTHLAEHLSWDVPHLIMPLATLPSLFCKSLYDMGRNVIHKHTDLVNHPVVSDGARVAHLGAWLLNFFRVSSVSDRPPTVSSPSTSDLIAAATLHCLVLPANCLALSLSSALSFLMTDFCILSSMDFASVSSYSASPFLHIPILLWVALIFTNCFDSVHPLT